MEKNKDKKPILAICYDFDKTLSPDDMQAQGYIQSIDYEVPEFWKESNQLAADNDMDQNLAYMYMMSQKSQGKALFTRKTLEADGAKVQLFPGVDTWFDRINEYGERKGVMVEHYIISVIGDIDSYQNLRGLAVFRSCLIDRICKKGKGNGNFVCGFLFPFLLLVY